MIGSLKKKKSFKKQMIYKWVANVSSLVYLQSGGWNFGPDIHIQLKFEYPPPGFQH